MSPTNQDNPLLIHPFSGELTQCSDQGFGFVDGPAGRHLMVQIGSIKGIAWNTVENIKLLGVDDGIDAVGAESKS